MLSVQQTVPFNMHVVDFLDAVSDQILHHSLDRSVPGLYSFGFWCRKKHLLQFQRKYQFREARQGKGLIFHICASNIPGLFAWSLAIGLLMGNSNLVRVSSGSDMVSKSYCNIFEKVLEKKKYHDLRNRMAVITYPRENERLTVKYSEQCDVRIIWGGDRAIEAIQKLRCKRKPEDIVFPDRTSAALLDAEKINRMSEDALMMQAHLFYDDTYSMDQNACSSPQLVLWYGTEAVCEKAAVRWWRAVNGLLDDYSVSEKQIYDKYSLACETAMQMDCRKITWVNQKLCHIELNTIKSDWDRFRGNSGIFLEYRIDSYQQIREADSGKLQTLEVFGVDISELQKVIISLNMKGISRVVNMGQAMEMDLVWDGTDLTQCLTEEKNDFFQWQKVYCNRKMLIDDQGRSVTYREAEQFGEEYFGNLRQETLIAILVQNTIGSVLIYMNALRHHLIPLLLDSKTDLNRFVEIVEKYKPEYIALPEGKDEYLTCLNRTYTDERYSEKWHAENYYFFSDEFSYV